MGNLVSIIHERQVIISHPYWLKEIHIVNPQIHNMDVQDMFIQYMFIQDMHIQDMLTFISL